MHRRKMSGQVNTHLTLSPLASAEGWGGARRGRNTRLHTTSLPAGLLSMPNKKMLRIWLPATDSTERHASGLSTWKWSQQNGWVLVDWITTVSPNPSFDRVRKMRPRAGTNLYRTAGMGCWVWIGFGVNRGLEFKWPWAIPSTPLPPLIITDVSDNPIVDAGNICYVKQA